MVDDAAQRARDNSYVAWRNVTPEHRKLFDTILQSPCHIIVTMRSKMDYLQKKDGDKTIIEKVGKAPVQRNGSEYEFGDIADLTCTSEMSLAELSMSTRVY